MTQIITVHGGLTNTPELKSAGNGTPFATFTVASSKRVQNRDTGQWEDGKDKLFLRCTAWGPLGDNINASQLERGARVAVTGELLTREWEQDGQRRSQVELKVTDLAVSLRYATAQVTRSQKREGGSGGSGQSGWNSPPPNDSQGFTGDSGGFGDWSNEPGF